jgi:fatty-acyl-CoA synthase
MQIDAVATHAHVRPQSLACMDLETGHKWNYRQFDRDINRIANWLVSQVGSASGVRVATVTRNSAEMLMLNLGCIRAGAIFVPLNWRLSEVEIAKLLSDCTPELLFTDKDVTGLETAADHYLLAELPAISREASDLPPLHARRSFDETSTILYTSGTSGRPKGVMLSEANAFWGQLNFISGNSVWHQSVFLCDMPLFHVAGLLANARAVQLAGGAVFISNGFDASKTLNRLADKNLGITHYFSVPQMAQQLWNLENFKPEMLQGLEVYATGGAPNPKAQIERFINAGIPMSDGFGMTETGPVSAVPLSLSEVVIEKAGSCGLPFIAMEVRVVDDQGGDLPANIPGELWLRGPGITNGYWQQPEITAQVFENGWFKSGDIAKLDQDGFIYLVDRKKDMFISGGENVYPAEIEAAIALLEVVAESAVVGIPDETWGEKGVAFVVPVVGCSVTEETIIKHCELVLAKYKVPKLVKIVESIPHTATGKIQKAELAKIA